MSFSAVAVAVDRNGQIGHACLKLRVSISNIGEVYDLLQLTPDRFEQWTLDFGADCLGRSTDGELLIPDFATFSKIAWMDIDNAIISSDELPDLVRECQLLVRRASDAQSIVQVSAIQHLAECAIDNGLAVRFGPA